MLHSVERGRGDRRLVLARASGSRVWDVDGKEYLDTVSGTNGPALVGHNHPAVREAVVAQLDRIADHFYVYDSPPVVELASRLAQIAPGELDKSIFCPGGGEGIEAAVKLAMRVTGKAEVVSLYGAYHGMGLATSGLGGMPVLREWMPGAQRWPTFRQGPAPDCYRCPLGLAHPDCELASAAALEATITEAGMNQVAALVIEPVQGPGGHVVFPPEWFVAVQSICRRHDVLLIVDEVQTGLGRLGSWYGWQTALDGVPVRPDVVCLAKALANGLPIGAIVAHGEAAKVFEPGDHATTFGGGPVVCAAALAVLGIIDRDGLVDRAATLGDRFVERIDALAMAGRLVTGHRGRGLLRAVTLDAPVAADVAAAALDDGLIVNAVAPDAVRFSPPLTLTDDELDEMLARFATAVDAVAREAS